MAQHGTLRDYRFTNAAEDIRGSHLYGTDDEKLGKIDDVVFDHSTGDISYAVVDTGGWLSSKKFIVPANRLRASEKHENDFAIDLTKEQVESFPPYEEANLESDEQWADYEGKYRSKWAGGPVMHREGTDRNITPTTQQIPGNSPSARAAGSPEANLSSGISTSGSDLEDVDALEETDTEEITQGGYAASTDSVVIENGPTGIGPRWDTFQNRLRERRKEVINTGEENRAA